MAKKRNSNPIQSRIGVGLFSLGLILGLVGIKINNSLLRTLSGYLWFFGLFFMAFGLTRIEIVDKVYQKFIRKSNKALLVLFPLAILFLILWGIFPAIWPVLLAFLVILLFVEAVWRRVFYVKSAIAIKKAVSKATPKENMRLLIWAIVVIILGLGLWYVINYVILKQSP